MQDAVAGAPDAVDGRGGPLAAARPGLAGGVEAVGYSTERTAGAVLFIYMADNVGLVIVDLENALVDDVLAIAAAAAGEAGLDPCDEAATRFLAELDQKHLVHRARQADVQLADATLGQGLQSDAVVGQALEEVCSAFLIARDSVESFTHDHVELPALHVSEESSNGGPVVQVGTGNPIVGKNGDRRSATCGRYDLKCCKLICRRTIVLQVR